MNPLEKEILEQVELVLTAIMQRGLILSLST